MSEIIISDAASSPTRVELPEALQEPTRSKSLLFMLLYMVASMVLGIGNITLGSILLAEHVAHFVSGSQQTSIFSLILALGAVVAAIAMPVMGMLSDRTTSRWGRRRPWYIAGGLLTVVDLFLMGHAPSLLLVTVGYLVLQVTINMLQMALSAILPDQVPVRQRATISGLSAGPGILLGGLLGQVLIAQFFTGIPSAYAALAITVAIMSGLFLLVLREAPLPRQHTQPLQMKQISGILRPLGRREFALIWVARCLMLFGYTTVVTFMFYYLQNAVRYSQAFPGRTTAQGVNLFFTLSVFSTILASVVAGIISDKLQRRKVFVIAASVAMSVALLLYAFFPVWTIVLVATPIMSIGIGIYFSVDFALASQVLPAASDRGKDMGIMLIAAYVPLILGPAIAGVVLGTLHSFLVLFSLVAVGTLISAVLIIPVKSVR